MASLSDTQMCTCIWATNDNGLLLLKNYNGLLLLSLLTVFTKKKIYRKQGLLHREEKKNKPLITDESLSNSPADVFFFEFEGLNFQW
jgi:hypothetical protein